MCVMENILLFLFVACGYSTGFPRGQCGGFQGVIQAPVLLVASAWDLWKPRILARRYLREEGMKMGFEGP